MKSLLLTKECDYGMRILRALSDGKIRKVKDIYTGECIPPQFCYKILKKLENGGLVMAKRGRVGGYILAKSTEEITLLDVVRSVTGEPAIVQCIANREACEMKLTDTCTIHKEFSRIQEILDRELSKKTFVELLQGRTVEGG